MKSNLQKKCIVVVLLLAAVFTNAQPTFNFKELPFSKYGSYTAFSVSYDSVAMKNRVFLRDVSGYYAWLPNEIFELEILVDGEGQSFTDFEATPWKLECRTKSGKLEIAYETNRIIRFRASEKATVRITKVKSDPRGWEWTIPVNEKQYRIHGGFDNYVITALNNAKLILAEGNRNPGKEAPREGVWTRFDIEPANGEKTEFALERHYVGWKQNVPSSNFDVCVNQVKKDFEEFAAKYPAVESKFDKSKFIASYVNWSCVVEPLGNIKRNGMLMSKALMRHIWSWDHCFNALALSYLNPEEAWNQFMIVFDNQFETGAIADYVNDDHFQLVFVKPPIHGLMYKRMMDRNPAFRTKEKLTEVYGPLTKWTNHWFDYLDDDNDGIPQYNHGCNSGWDNNTVFDIGFALEGAELSSFLVIQMDLLAEIATSLGKKEEASDWKRRSEVLLNKLIKELWNGNNFVFARSGDGQYNKESQSLIYYVPMILGDKLPAEIRQKMIDNLKNSGLITAYGPATENPNSPFYERDGYWRGPIWAPSTYLIVEGINACGDTEYAKEIARRFCNTCNTSGFRENFVATTGEGLRDLGYTWTSSVFLVLAHDYLYEK